MSSLRSKSSSLELALKHMLELHSSSSAEFVESDAATETSPAPETWSWIDEKVYERFPSATLVARAEVEPDPSTARNRNAVRRSHRSFSPEPVCRSAFEAVLCTALSGTTRRPYPSAGARYPVEVYPVARRVADIATGVFHFGPAASRLTELFGGAKSTSLVEQAVTDDAVNPAFYLVLTAVLPRICIKYGARGYRYSLVEIGSVATLLDAACREQGLGCVWLGGFDDDKLARAVGLSPEQELEFPMLVMACGHALG